MSKPDPGGPPSVYEPEADVPFTPIEGVTDQRVLDVAREGFNLQLLIRRLLPDSNPNVELACRYVDLAVQAAHTAAQDIPRDSPPVASGEPTGTRRAPQAPGRSASPPEAPSGASHSRKQGHAE